MNAEPWIEAGTWIGISLVISVAAVGVWLVTVRLQRRAYRHLGGHRGSSRRGYRDLAERAVQVQDDVAEHLKDIEARLTEVERMLREVDEPRIAR